jgi:two-component system, NarL family, nitrate/nitrite response regulator NarL
MSFSIVVADDHPMLLDGIVGLLIAAGKDVKARCLDGQQARDAINLHHPDIAILDIHMPHLSGLDLLREARRDKWKTRIVILTASLDPQPIMEALHLRVDGLILKGAGGDVLLKCLERVMEGEQWLDRDAMHQIVEQLGKPAERPLELTPRETEVARLVSLGSRNKEIARELDISEGTVKMHLHNLYEKLNVSSRTELAILVRDKGLS